MSSSPDVTGISVLAAQFRVATKETTAVTYPAR